VGEDVFYQAVKSIRTGLVLSTLTTLNNAADGNSLWYLGGIFFLWGG
jgi:hypothetical protein